MNSAPPNRRSFLKQSAGVAAAVPCFWDVWTHCNSVNACHIANVSMLLKRKVRFDRQKYQFVGDDQANRLIRRHQRSPWQIVL